MYATIDTIWSCHAQWLLLLLLLHSRARI
jgi:hypothetical protein